MCVCVCLLCAKKVSVKFGAAARQSIQRKRARQWRIGIKAEPGTEYRRLTDISPGRDGRLLLLLNGFLYTFAFSRDEV